MLGKQKRETDTRAFKNKMKYYIHKFERFFSYSPECPTEVIWIAFATKSDIYSKAWESALGKAFDKQYPIWRCPYGQVKTKLDHLRHCWSTPLSRECLEISKEIFDKMMFPK